MRTASALLLEEEKAVQLPPLLLTSEIVLP
jgi:hypothetical protein